MVKKFESMGKEYYQFIVTGLEISGWHSIFNNPDYAKEVLNPGYWDAYRRLHSSSESDDSGSSLYIIIGIVAAVLIVAAIVIIICIKKRGDTRDSGLMGN